MKTAYIAAGAGGMYCGACLHDNTLAAALIEAGHDVLLVPTYTPLRTDERDVSLRRVFLGGINVFLQQKFAFFRHTPWPFDWLFDRPGLIRFLSGRSVSIDARELGALAVSVLRGEDGNQRKELAKLVHWLRNEVRPDIVHLTNAMFVAMAGPIRREVGVPVVCGLAGEDVFLERVLEPHYSQARELMRRHAADVAAFVSLNRYYADFMIDYMRLDPSRVHVIHHGLNLAGHGTRPHAPGGPTVNIGFFARVCPDKGLHRLVEAFRLLCQDPTLPPLRLRVAGYLAAEDKSYLADLRARLTGWGLAERFEYAGELDRAGKIAFLQSLDLMCLPTVYRESKGLSVLEALANAVPVVLPRHGAFPEYIADTGGGVLFPPEDTPALVAALRPLILDRELATRIGLRGQQAIRERYNAAVMADRTIALYRATLGGHADAWPASGSQRAADGPGQPAPPTKDNPLPIN
jgi:glycosyltransferase involved in cell wall biosynthesis